MTAAPTSEPLAAAISMHDAIVAQRARTQAERRIAEPIVAALTDARLNRLMLPVQLNGWALPAVELLRVLEALARADASVAWVIWNNTLPCLYSRKLTPDARADLFAERNWLYANSTRPSGKASIVDGGYRVSGRWSLVSGCELAEWAMFMCLVEADGELQFAAPGLPEMRLAFVNKREWEVIDTWHVGGMSGTGSHDVVVDDRFIETARTCSPMDPSSLDEPVAYLPIVSTLAAGLSAQLLGAAQLAVDTVVAIGRSKTSPGVSADMRDRSPTQIAVAAHSAAVNAARLYVQQAVERVWRKALDKHTATTDDIAEVWAAALHADDVARLAVDAMYAAAGTTAVYTDCPLEQLHRDVRVMLQHIVAQPLCVEEVGRYKLGLDSVNPQLWT